MINIKDLKVLIKKNLDLRVISHRYGDTYMICLLPFWCNDFINNFSEIYSQIVPENELIDKGIPVYVCDNIEYGINKVIETAKIINLEELERIMEDLLKTKNGFEILEVLKNITLL